MHTSSWRARRGLAPLALAPLALATIVAAADGSAGASGPNVTTRVSQRTLVVKGGRDDDVINLFSSIDRPTDVVVALGLEATVVASVRRDTFDRIAIDAGDGNDLVLIDERAGFVPFTDTEPTTIRAGAGDDFVSGGSGPEDIRGGSGRDMIDGNGGDDTVALGPDDDQVVWDQGDGSDTIEGGAGRDVMSFNGAPFNESFAARADDGRLRITRVEGDIVMDVDDVEDVSVNTLGGSDFTEIGDLRGTDVDVVTVDDGSIPGGDAPDGVIDTVNVAGTPDDDDVTIAGDVGLTQIDGPPATVLLVDMDRLDALRVLTGNGADTIDASGLSVDAVHVVHITGPGDDVVLGGPGLDEVLAGRGCDVVDGGRGDDDIDLDEGDDEMIWDPGDGSDLVDGGAGTDVMTFNGSDDDEVMEASAIGEDLVVTRDVGFIRMSTVRLERLDVNARGGADLLTVGDLTGTTVERVRLGLAAVGGAADGAADGVVVRGTPGADAIIAGGAAGAARIFGLPWAIAIDGSEPTDVLTIDGNGGDDTVDTAGLGPDTIQPAPPA